MSRSIAILFGMAFAAWIAPLVSAVCEQSAGWNKIASDKAPLGASEPSGTSHVTVTRAGLGAQQDAK